MFLNHYLNFIKFIYYVSVNITVFYWLLIFAIIVILRRGIVVCEHAKRDGVWFNIVSNSYHVTHGLQQFEYNFSKKLQTYILLQKYTWCLFQFIWHLNSRRNWRVNENNIIWLWKRIRLTTRQGKVINCHDSNVVKTNYWKQWRNFGATGYQSPERLLSAFVSNKSGNVAVYARHQYTQVFIRQFAQLIFLN